MKRSFLPLLFAIFATMATSFAQNRVDYSYVVATNPYLTRLNPSYFDMAGVDKLAAAQVSFGKSDGDLVPIEGSSDSFDAGAATEAFVKVSDRIAFYGKLSYSYFNGKNMGGQVLVCPEQSPVNFLESTDTTLGVKVREFYDVSGGMTYRFNRKISAGLRFDYSSGDQTKMKDPRFINYLMDLNIAAGLNWSAGSRWNLGFTAAFRNNVENIKGHVYGTTDKQYFVYTDLGGYWGVMEQLDGDYSNLPTSSLRPYINTRYGLCFDFNHIYGTKFFNTLKLDYLTGYYGRNATDSPIFFEHFGFDARYSGTFLFQSGANTHKIVFEAVYSPLFNSQNSFEYNTPPGKATVVVYKGQAEILERHDVSSHLSYSLFGKMEGHYRPEFMIGASADFFYRTQTATVYPSCRKHEYGRCIVNLKGERSLFKSSNVYTAAINLLYRAGFGTAKEDGSLGSGTTKLKSFDSWLDRQFEYETASRIGGGLSFTYSRIFSQKLAVDFTLEDDFAYLLAEPQFLKGRYHNNLTFKTVFNF